MAYHLGVDLGTTFVAAALATDGRVEMFTLGDRTVVTPAVVYLRDDDTLVCGDVAARRMVSAPDRVARQFKRRLGDPTPVMLGGAPHEVTSLLGTLLLDVITRVTEAEGAKPASVVLTHPANWGPYRRELFEEVPEVAGITSPRTVTEPEAAAAYYATRRDLADGEVIAVYDLGGGTFDVTVLRKHAGGIEILGVPEGIERLGGIDFDESIISHINYTTGGALTDLDISDPRAGMALARLRQDCVLAKEALSIDNETTIPVFLPNRHLDVSLTRAEFEDMIRAPIESTIGVLVRTLRRAGVDPNQLSAVLLVGGSSRIPLVARMISEALGRPTVVDAHPKYAVALGAATLAMGGAAPTRGDGVDVRAPGPTTVAEPAGAPSGRAEDTSRRRPTHPVAKSGPLAARSGGAPPPPPPPPPALGSAGSGRRVLLVVAMVVTLLTFIGGVGFVTVNRFSARAESGAAPAPAEAAPAQTEPEAQAAAPDPVAASVPDPFVGPAIRAGNTPAFVVVAPNGGEAYIANRDAGVITVVDTTADRVTATIPVPAGPPQFLTFSPDGSRVYVSIWNEARTVAAVGVLDATTHSIIATIPVRSRPFLTAVTPDGRQLYVPNHDSGTVSVIDLTTNTVTTQIQVAPHPHWIEISKDGTRAYIANHESNLVSLLDTSNNTVLAEVPVDASPHSVAVHPTRPLVANVNFDADTVTMIDTDTAQVVARIPVGDSPQDITWAPDGRFAYTANVYGDTVSVINAETMTVSATLPVGKSPTSVAVRPDGTTGYVTNIADGTVTVLQLSR